MFSSRLSSVHSMVHVLNPQSAVAVYSASPFAYYGPQLMNITGPAVFLNGRELCAPPRGVVSGSIVFSDKAGYYCTYGTAYKRLNAAGAKAFILFDIWNPSCIFMYQHQNWAPCAFCDKSMAMVGMYWGKDGRSLVASWKRFSRLEIRIVAPFDDSCQIVETSWAWLVILRIFAPVFSFATAAIAMSALWSRVPREGPRKPSWSVGFVILAAEIPICIVVGIALACGELISLPQFEEPRT